RANVIGNEWSIVKALWLRCPLVLGPRAGLVGTRSAGFDGEPFVRWARRDTSPIVRRVIRFRSSNAAAATVRVRDGDPPSRWCHRHATQRAEVAARSAA